MYERVPSAELTDFYRCQRVLHTRYAVFYIVVLLVLCVFMTYLYQTNNPWMTLLPASVIGLVFFVRACARVRMCNQILSKVRL